jgi:HSP20 family protein
MRNLILRRNNEIDQSSTEQNVCSLQSQINKIFEDFLSPFDFYTSINSYKPEKIGFPRIDLAETDAEYKIRAELPGMSDKDVELTYNDGVLTISGERKDECETEEKGYYYKESSYGSFRRSIRLPENIDDKKIEAGFKNGVLTIIASKSKENDSKVRKIAISSK